MPDLRVTRKKVKFVLIAILVFDVFLALFYISPLVGSAEMRRQELSRLEVELRTKTRQGVGIENIPDKIALARHQIASFRDRFPGKQSEISSEIGKLTAECKVTIEHGTMRYDEDTHSGLQRVEMQYEFNGSYVALAQFINALERDHIVFIVDNITFGSNTKSVVNLRMKFETYLKATE